MGPPKPKMSTLKTKVVVRQLPPGLKEGEFRELVDGGGSRGSTAGSPSTRGSPRECQLAGEDITAGIAQLAHYSWQSTAGRVQLASLSCGLWLVACSL